MCGRYTLIKKQEEIEERFDAQLSASMQQLYNAAPSQKLLIITNREKKKIQYYHWGFLPFWAKKKSQHIINAKSETIDQKSTFRKSFEQRRCLVIADGFYEWKRTKSGKVPYRITKEGEPLFAMAGIWRQWTDTSTGEVVPSFAIITTVPNKFMEPIHHRMPVILPSTEESTWLKNDTTKKALKRLLRPYEGTLTAYQVPKKVNSPANNTADVIQPINGREGRLF